MVTGRKQIRVTDDEGFEIVFSRTANGKGWMIHADDAVFLADADWPELFKRIGAQLAREGVTHG